MHVKRTPTIRSREAGCPQVVREFVQSLVEATEPELIYIVDGFIGEWNRPRGDLCFFIPILDRMDDILERIVAKYSLDQDVPQPLSLEQFDEQLLISILKFTALLLEKCSNRNIYGSLKHVSLLLNCISATVVASALLVCVQIGARLMQTKTGRDQVRGIDSEKIFQLATFLPISHYEKVEKHDITLFDFIDPNRVWSDSWAAFKFQYYSRSAKAAPVTPTPKSQGKGGTHEASISEGLTPLFISPTEVQETSSEKLLEKIYATLPREYWFAALNRIRVAKAFTNTEQGLSLRQELCRIQCLATCFALCLYSESSIDSRLIAKCPTLIKQICDIASPDHLGDVPVNMTVTAMQTLECACNHNDRLSEVVAGLSANVGHGILMTLMRDLLHDLQSGAEINEIRSVGLLQMVMVITGAAHQVGLSITNELMPTVMSMVEEDTKYTRTKAYLAELLDHLLMDSTSLFNLFQENKYIDKCIELVKREVDYAAKPDLNEDRPTLCIVDYEMSYFRTQLLRCLLSLISNVLQHTRTAERINNLADSSLLQLSKTIVNNSKRFGYKVVSLNLTILANMLETESSSFAIMHEANVTELIVEAIPSLLDTSTLYFTSIAKFISALCHNEQGQKLVKEKDLLNKYFRALAKDIANNESLKSLGSTFDVLTSDHPDLRSLIISEVIKLLKTLLEKLQAPSTRFYHESESTSARMLPSDDVMMILTNALGFFEGFFKNHLTRVEFIKQKGVACLLDLFKAGNLPYDFAFSHPAYILSAVMRSLFDLDIDTDYIQNEMLTYLSQAIGEVEKLIAPVSPDSQVVKLDESSLDPILRALGQLNSQVFAFYHTVFVNPGTGYRILFVLEKIIKYHDNIFHRLCSIQRWCVWQDARSLDGLTKQLIEISKPVPIECAPRSWRSLYEKEAAKKVVEAQETCEESKTEFFKQLKVFRFLAHADSVLVGKFCYEFATICTNERAMTSRKKMGLHMADLIASALTEHLEFSPVATIDDPAFRNAKYQTIVNIVTTIQRTIFKSWKSSASLAANLGVFICFKQRRGIELVGRLISALWVQPLEEGVPEDESSLLVSAQKVALSLMAQMVFSKSIVDIPRAGSLFSRESSSAEREYFSLPQFYVECRLQAMHAVKDLWQSEELEKKHHSVTNIFVEMMTKLLSPNGEDSSGVVKDKSKLPRELSWEYVCPSEDKVAQIQSLGFSEDEARNELSKADDDIRVALASLGVVPEDIDELELSFPIVYGFAPRDIEGDLLVTVEDLNSMREDVKKSLIDRAISLVQCSPKNVFSVASLIIKAYSATSNSGRSDRQREAFATSQKTIVRKILHTLASYDLTADSETESIAAIAHMLGVIMQDSMFFGNAIQDVTDSLDVFIKMLNFPEASKKEWFPNVLLTAERIVTSIDVPKIADREYDFKFPQPTTSKVPTVSQDLIDSIFNSVSNLEDMGSEKSALAIARLVVHFSKRHEYSVELFKRGTVMRIMRCIQQFAGSPNFDKLQVAICLILRHCVESDETIKQIIAVDIKSYFVGNRVADIGALVKFLARDVCRSPALFVEVASDLLAFQEGNLNSSHVCLKETFDARIQRNVLQRDSMKEKLKEAMSETKAHTPEELSTPATEKQPVLARSASATSNADEKMDDVVSEPPVPQFPTVEEPSGIIQLILTELLKFKRSDIFIRPEKTDRALQDEMSKKERPEFKPVDHKDFVYFCSLLLLLAELLGSYNQCKLEFLNFSRKSFNMAGPSGPLAKPRSFALNYFLHELLPIGSLDDSVHLVLQQWQTISSLAGQVLISLLTATQEKGRLRENHRQTEQIQADPELVFVRKFALDAFAKTLKEIHMTNEHVDYRYSALSTLSELCYKMLSNRSTGSLSLAPTSGNNDQTDAAAIATIMYDKKFASIFTDNLAEIDLNYPNVKKLAKVSVRFLNKLSRLALDQSTELVQDREEEEEEFPSDSEDNEEAYGDDTPDLFRNSTLGMFEIGEDFDEEEADDEVYDEMEDDEELEEYEDHDEALSDVEQDTSRIDETLEFDDSEDDEESDDSEMDDADDMDIELVVGSDEDDEMEDDDDLDEESSDWESYDEDDDGIIEIDIPWGEEDGADDEAENSNEEDDEEADDGESDSNDIDRPADGLGEVDVINGGADDIIHGGTDILAAGMRRLNQLFDDAEEDVAFAHGRGQVPGLAEVYSSDENDEIDSDADMETILEMHGNRWERDGGSALPADAVSNPLLVHPRGNTLTRPTFVRHYGRAADGLNAISQMVDGADNDAIGRSHHMLLSDMFGQFASMFSMQDRRDMGEGYDLDPFGEDPRFSWSGRSRQNPILSIFQRHSPLSTSQRWQEACHMFYVYTRPENSHRVINDICNRIAEASMELDVQLQKVKEELSEVQSKYADFKEERLQREKEKRELEELKLREEDENTRKREEDEAAAAAEKEQLEDAAQEDEDVLMESATSSAVEETSGVGEPSENRVVVQISGQDVDITGMGIDPEFLEALPAEMREEVLAQHIRDVRAHRNDPSVATDTSGAIARDIDQDFLDALPDNIRDELIQEDQLQQRLQARAAETGEAVEMDVSSFLATLDPHLRQQLLLEQDDLSLATFPPEVAEEARGLRNRTVAHFPAQDAVVDDLGADGRGNDFRIRRIFHTGDEEESGRVALHSREAEVDDGEEAKTTEEKSRQKVISAAALHLVDRSGVAALIRLLYLPQGVNQRNTFNELLHHLCANRQTRLDILNLILHVLQDGSGDRHSLEKGFVQTSNRARQASTPAKVPTPKGSKLSMANVMLSTDISPATVMQQALESLEHLVTNQTQIKYFFMIEHENPVCFRKSRSKKGKEKEKEVPKEWNYPINMLINMLDRNSVRENNVTLEMLTVLIYEVTRNLSTMLRDNSEKPKRLASEKSHIVAEEESSGAKSLATGNEPTGDSSKPKKRSKLIDPPYIPEYNLRRVAMILTARECSGKSFQQALGVIQNLSCIPGVKDLFGTELMKQAMSLGPAIVSDLKALVEKVKTVVKGSDLQGATLANFSSASSDQAKLLRVLTAVDYLFDSSRDKKGKSKKKDEGAAYLKSLYESMTFGPLWSSLSDCLTLVRDRQDMIHVATALLPLIESLMVICKHSSVKDVQIRGDKYEHRENDFSKEPLESLFFTFTDEHRKILNQIVRTNPKLMSGSFSILVKNSKALEFDNKRRYFYKRICPNNEHASHNINLNVRRDQVFLDSYKAMYFKGADEIKKSRLNVKFQGEEGIDAGGVTREWFQVLSRQMFNPDYALFIPVASDNTTFHPNRTSWVNPEHLSFFKFIGRIIGKAIYDYRVLDCHFSRAVYKKILGKTVSIKDMESLDLDYYKSLVWMLENDITDIITETFSIETKDYGEEKIIDLKPNGRNIAVTEENKHEYVNFVVEYRLLESIKDQMDHFLQGFHDIIPKEVVAIFDEQELELLISGMPDIDLDDWRNNTTYNNYTASSPQIKWFWRAVRSFDEEEKAKLLQFATGTSKVPLNGFGELEGMNGIQKFSIHKGFGSKDRLPTSHTCFNQIDLPEYDSYETLRGSLLMAITEGREGFGFA